MSDLRDFMIEQFTGACEKTAKELEILAATIRAHGAKITRVPSPGTATAGSLASRVVAEAGWGFGNAGLDRIVSTAAEFDRTMAEEAAKHAAAKES